MKRAVIELIRNMVTEGMEISLMVGLLMDRFSLTQIEAERALEIYEARLERQMLKNTGMNEI